MLVKKNIILISLIGVTAFIAACSENTTDITETNNLAIMSDNFSAGNEVFRGTYTPDSKQFYFFRKVTPGQEDYRIFTSTNQQDGWSEPEEVQLGGDFNDLYPDISADGKHMIFASYRPFPGGDPERPETNLWMVDFDGDKWGDPYPLVELSDPARHQSGPRFGPEGSIYFEQYSADWRTVTTYIAKRDDAGKFQIEEDPLIGKFKAELSDKFHVWSGRLSHDGRLFFLSVAEKNEEGRAKLESTGYWVSVKDKQGWSDPLPLIGGVNSPDKTDNFLTMTHDGETLSFVRDFREFWTIPLKAALPEAIAETYYK